jgi:hypothetical protein
VFNGSGHYAGKMLVINWGDKDPVIYSFDDEGSLDGEWADGSATETLTPVGTAASSDDDVSPPEGEYRVEGKGGDGKPYEGTVDIEKDGDAYALNLRRQSAYGELGQHDADRLRSCRRWQPDGTLGQRTRRGDADARAVGG